MKFFYFPLRVYNLSWVSIVVCSALIGPPQALRKLSNGVMVDPSGG